MAEISLIRVDSRLIHGQVITKWRKIFNITKIVVVDDSLANDEFMIRMYEAAAPAGVKVKVYGVEKAKRLWDKNQFGTEGRVLLLFKDIPTCYKLYEQGVPMNYIQIGGVVKTADRKVILQAVSLNESEMELLGKFHQNGCEVAIQIVPEDTRLSYEEIVKKYKEK